MGATQSKAKKEIVEKQVVKVQKDILDSHVVQYLQENYGKDESYELLGYVSSSHEDESLSDSNKPSLPTHNTNIISTDYSLSSSSQDKLELESDIFEFEQSAKKQKEANDREQDSLKMHVKHQGPQIGQERMQKLYGKGFQLLKQMGYTGGGLGKKGTGIVAPIQSQIRHKKEGLKEQGWRESSNKNFAHDDDPALSALDDLLNKQRSSSTTYDEWHVNKEKRSETHSHKKTMKKHKVQFTTSDELIQSASETYKNILKKNASASADTNPKDGMTETSCSERLSKRFEKVKKYSHFLKDLHAEECLLQDPSQFRVVDMTGPTTRVINNLSEFQLQAVFCILIYTKLNVVYWIVQKKKFSKKKSYKKPWKS
ncbi:septin and tuftelin-interacting protein 1 homolog [Hylaeus volcanicus]|uniref:septin and tuftelin-interacting protein 1 homolog n=1 Tax=Hylaeus volcanicus TaxID=313075 RepID=UPI0023B8372C|nr:septin and tuftelin-interacting protein 1 homolog [Hylaeus volcanicus]